MHRFRRPISIRNKRIVISKINRIGDVLCALPMASALKNKDASCTVIFLGNSYAADVISQYVDVDEFVAWDQWQPYSFEFIIEQMQALRADVILHVLPNRKIARLAKRAQIPVRMGTSHRLYHWTTCNFLVNIGRSKYPFHEMQFDFMHLHPFGFHKQFSLEEIIKLRQFRAFVCPLELQPLLMRSKFNLILHPKTFVEKREWPIENFAELISRLDPQQFTIFITGTEKEGLKMRASCVEPFAHVHDLTGKISLNNFIHFVAHADGLIAASTGPVHIAANVGIHTLGLYTALRPYDSTRWGPIGPKAETLQSMTNNENLDSSLKNISVDSVLAVVKRWYRDWADKS